MGPLNMIVTSRSCLSSRLWLVAAFLVVLVYYSFSETTYFPADSASASPGNAEHDRIKFKTQAKQDVETALETNVKAGCTIHQKPNVIVSANDGNMGLEHTFIFMNSLDVALGQELLMAQRNGHCPPAPVEVKIMGPPEWALHPPAGMKAILNRHPNLELLGTLPQPAGHEKEINSNRFIAWQEFLDHHRGKYGSILNSDLDVAFQRNPFSIPIGSGEGVVFFNEWSGLSIGNEQINSGWTGGCNNGHMSGEFVSKTVSDTYMDKDIICAGNTYGTVKGMAVYYKMMVDGIQKSKYECNDQAYHYHIAYSGELQQKLESASAGNLTIMRDRATLLNPIGTTPYVRWNEWGEVLNDEGTVIVAAHQFKWHPRLLDIFSGRFGWRAPPGSQLAESPVYRYDDEWQSKNPDRLPRTRIVNLLPGMCTKKDEMCSCRYEDCQSGHYN